MQDQVCCEIDVGGIFGGALRDAGLGGFGRLGSGDAGIDLSFLRTCSGDLNCIGGKCGACGGNGEACCPPLNSCDNGLGCVQDKCQKCGQPGQPCCAASGAPDGWPGFDVMCQDGMCVGPMSCGLLNEPCCGASGDGATGTCSAPATVCHGGSCTTCGGVDQPCCNGGSGTQRCSTRGAVCTDGSCRMQ